MAKKCVVIRELPSQNAVDYRFAVMANDIENGHVVGLKNLKENERDLWIAEAPTAAANLWLVTGVELMYQEAPLKSAADYINETGHPFRVERVLAGGIYAISTEGLTIAKEDTDLKVGSVVTFASGAHKLTVAASASSNVVGKVIDIYTKAGQKFVAIEFAKAAA